MQPHGHFFHIRSIQSISIFLLFIFAYAAGLVPPSLSHKSAQTAVSSSFSILQSSYRLYSSPSTPPPNPPLSSSSNQQPSPNVPSALQPQFTEFGNLLRRSVSGRDTQKVLSAYSDLKKSGQQIPASTLKQIINFCSQNAKHAEPLASVFASDLVGPLFHSALILENGANLHMAILFLCRINLLETAATLLQTIEIESASASRPSNPIPSDMIISLTMTIACWRPNGPGVLALLHELEARKVVQLPPAALDSLDQAIARWLSRPKAECINDVVSILDVIHRRFRQHFSQATYIALFKNATGPSWIHSGVEIIEEMKKLGVQIPIRVYESLIRSLIMKGQGREALEAMYRLIENGVTPTKFMWNSMLYIYTGSAGAATRDLEKALLIVKQMAANGNFSDLSPTTLESCFRKSSMAASLIPLLIEMLLVAQAKDFFPLTIFPDIAHNMLTASVGSMHRVARLMREFGDPLAPSPDVRSVKHVFSRPDKVYHALFLKLILDGKAAEVIQCIDYILAHHTAPTLAQIVAHSSTISLRVFAIFSAHGLDDALQELVELRSTITATSPEQAANIQEAVDIAVHMIVKQVTDTQGGPMEGLRVLDRVVGMSSVPALYTADAHQQLFSQSSSSSSSSPASSASPSAGNIIVTEHRPLSVGLFQTWEMLMISFGDIMKHEGVVPLVESYLKAGHKLHSQYFLASYVRAILKVQPDAVERAVAELERFRSDIAAASSPAAALPSDSGSDSTTPAAAVAATTTPTITSGRLFKAIDFVGLRIAQFLEEAEQYESSSSSSSSSPSSSSSSSSSRTAPILTKPSQSAQYYRDLLVRHQQVAKSYGPYPSASASSAQSVDWSYGVADQGQQQQSQQDL